MPTSPGLRESSTTELLYILLQKLFALILYIQRSRLIAPRTQPDAVKKYSCRPHLHATRIFRPAAPPATANGNENARLPLIILVHGGGFVVNTPARDDPLARYLADTCASLVACIDYSKAPQRRFPVAYEDVVVLSRAVIHDPDLPVDKARVVLCGNSAGGNLVLAAAQDAQLREQVLGVIGLYPVVDFFTTVAQKVARATRADACVPDMLASSAPRINRMYIGPQEVELEDVRLSPTFFGKREDLPAHVWLIGVEYDLLCAEAGDMAERLAEGAEKVETKGGWRAGGVRWDCVPGQTHGFDQFGTRGRKYESQRLAQKTQLYLAMADWLTELFSSCDSKVVES